MRRPSTSRPVGVPDATSGFRLNPTWSSLAMQYARVQLLYNPVITGVAVLALGGGGDLRAFAITFTIAAVSSTVSFAFVALGTGWSHHRQRRARAPLGQTAYFALALLGMPLGLFLAATVTAGVFDTRVPGSALDYRLGAFLGVLFAGLSFSWQLVRDAKRAALSAELERERAERRGVEARLAALTAQLNPHLLFNALNTIASLIQGRPDQAEETLLRLAELYRGLLAATRRQAHTLEDELEICRAYLDVERARFAERLNVHLEIDSRLETERLEVPVLVLQPLVENALEHGIASRARGGSVWVVASAAANELLLRVVDDGVGLGHSSHEGSGVGIENTRQRLLLCYGDAATLTLSSPAAGGTEAMLRLPLQSTPR